MSSGLIEFGGMVGCKPGRRYLALNSQHSRTMKSNALPDCIWSL